MSILPLARDIDIVLIDVAGRLHTKTDLMQELAKIKGVCAKLIEKAPHEVLLTIDATTGQNGIDQAVVFHEYVPITGIIQKWGTFGISIPEQI